MQRFFLISLVGLLVTVATIAPAHAALELGVEEDEPQIMPVETAAEESDPTDGQVNTSAEQLGLELPISDKEEPEILPNIDPAESVTPKIVISQIQTSSFDSKTEELIEIYNNSDEDIDVTDWCIKKASATGASYATLKCLKDISPGSSIILYARSCLIGISTDYQNKYPNAEYSFTFSAGLSDVGGRVVLLDENGQSVDLVAWGEGTLDAEGESPILVDTSAQGILFKRRSVTDSVMQDTNDNAADFQQIIFIDICVNIDGLQSEVPDGWYVDRAGNCTSTPPLPANECRGVIISEIAANTDNQFIELHNITDQAINLEGCLLQTNRSQTAFALPATHLEAGADHAIYIGDTDLKLTKTTTGTVYLLSSDGVFETDSRTYANLASGTAWAWFGESGWRQTYTLTPAATNIYTEYPPCQDGYERNTQTGRCRKVDTASTLAPCKEGQYRSEETNRCRSIAAAANTLKPCADDQFRNPETNRCKKIASADDVALADCGEGRERNPATNRCRNIPTSSIPEADFAIEPINQSSGELWGWWVLGGVGALALGYAIWEWHPEIASGWRKVTTFSSRNK